MRKHVLCMLVLLLSALGVMAQDVVVTGKVVTANNEPLPGVSVTVKGTTKGTATDGNGAYTLKAPSNAILTFNFIGYIGQEITVGNRTTINVTLKEDALNLEQVVVIGYGTQKKKDLTGAVASISSKEIAERPIVNSAQAIQGKAAGVQVVQNSGKPGGNFAMRVRGSTSFTASNDPLYVIDGIPTTDNSIVNPNDIEDIQILKDASSAAIYGARAANGVVLITTKKGSVSRPKLSFSTYTGFSTVIKKLDVLNVEQYRALLADFGSTDNNKQNTDWQNEIFGRGSEQNYQLSVAGGSDKTQYYFSGSYAKQNGVIAPAKYDRFALKANVDAQATDWFKLSGNLNFVRAKSIDVKDNESVSRGGVISSALTTPPTIGIYAPNGTYQDNPNKSGWSNPIANAYAEKNNPTTNRVMASIAGDINLLPGLKFRTNAGLDLGTWRKDTYLDPVMTQNGRDQGGIGTTDNTQTFAWLWENTLNYNKQFGKHGITGLAGITTQESRWDRTFGQVSKYSTSAPIETLNGGNRMDNILTDASEWALVSYLARATYNYADRYLLTANFRIDGSSRFAPNNKYATFPSVSAGWRVSEESFLKNKIQSLSDLKLRLGWGQNGNQEGIGDYTYWGRYSPNRGTAGIGYTPVSIQNDNLKWETTTQTNIGLDLAMFNYRVSFTADAYMKKTEEMLVRVPMAGSLAYPDQLLNVGSMENKGLEFTLSTKNLVDDFKWSTDFNISFNRNKVTGLGSALDKFDYGYNFDNRGVPSRIVPGRPIGSFYGYIADGVDPQTGAAKYKDLNNDGKINEDDRTFIGNALPKFSYGFTNNLSFKNFNLSIFFQGVSGNDILNLSRLELEGLNDSRNQSTAVLNRWKKPGDITDIPAIEKGTTNNSRISTRFVEKGSYLRLKDITLSYNFTQKWMNKMGVSKISPYFTAQNVFTITDYKGFDPEVNYTDQSDASKSGISQGIDFGTYPQYRTFILGLNVAF